MIDIAPEANKKDWGELEGSQMTVLLHVRRLRLGSSLAGSLEQDLQVMPQRADVRGPHVDVPLIRARLREPAAQLDHLPSERTPIPPGLLSLLHQDAAHHFPHDRQ